MEPSTNLSAEDGISTQQSLNKDKQQPQPTSTVNLRHLKSSTASPLQTADGSSPHRTQPRSSSIVSLRHYQPPNDTLLQTDSDVSPLPKHSFGRRVARPKQLHLPFVDDDANEKQIAYESNRRVVVADKNEKVTVERMEKKRQREDLEKTRNRREILGSTSKSEDHDTPINKRRRLSTGVFNNSQNWMTPVRYSRVSEARESTINNKEQTRRISEHENGPAEKKRRIYYEGFVADFICKENGEHFGYIRCQALAYEGEQGRKEEKAVTNNSNWKHNDVFFPFENVQSNLLELVKCDEVEFCVFDTNKIKNKFKAKLVKIIRLHERKHKVLLDYLTEVKEMLIPQKQKIFIYGTHNTEYDSDFEFTEIEVNKACCKSTQEIPTLQNKLDPSKLLKLVADPTVWQMVTEQISDLPNGNTLLCLLLEVVALLHKARRTLEEGFRQVLVSITSSSKFFNPISGRLLSFIKTSCTSNLNVKLIQDFLLLVAQLVPEKRPAITAFIKPMMEKPNEYTAIFLYKTLRTLSLGSSESIADLDWRHLPLILNKKEILASDLDCMVNIRPVQVTGNYDCSEDYMDVYFRLLREDCLNQLRKCIRQLLDGKLDIRDMNVYKSLCLVGMSLKHNTLYLALRVVSVKEIQNWEACSNLMFGNLLCISIGGSFQKPIWVTVAIRDLMKKDSIVIVQSCWEWNEVDDAEILLNLITYKGPIWMVESPTYYRAFQPVLQTLQQLDANSISFKEELVNLKPGPLPDFLHDTNDFNACLVHKVPQQKRITIKDFLDTPHSDNSLFDASQEEAVKNALKNRIGIIQGPPGSGKSFIGVKMLQLLLSLSSLGNPKVLVLTYKNHALDEFLKDTLKFISPSNMVRIGGRCKDPELFNISLGNLKKTMKEPETQFKRKRLAIQDLHDKSDKIQGAIRRDFKSLNRLRDIQVQMIHSYLSQEQEASLLLGFPWDSFNFCLGFDIGPYKRGVRISENMVNNITTSEIWHDVAMVYEIKNIALKHWMPASRDFDAVESFLIGTINSIIELKIPTAKELKERNEIKNCNESNNTNESKKSNKSKNNRKDEAPKDDFDMEDQEEIEERMFAPTKAPVAVEKDFYETFLMVDQNNERSNKIKSFSEDVLQILKEMKADIFFNLNNMWGMNKEERIKFTQMAVYKEKEEIKKSLAKNLNRYKNLCKQKIEIENQRTASILKKMKVVGATITGASINQQLLKEIQPEIVIVEEAAEVLEPQLLASIGTWTKYMLLIGDHQQLKPSVESYELRRNYNFDLSMMERLINNNMSFRTLQMQNRQRVEFAELLLDIYPGLQTNHERVKHNEPATCLQKSSFFWHHTETEIKDRSVTNPEEAKRAVKLALFLVQQGYQRNKITILATYRRQTALIRNILREYEVMYDTVIKNPNASNENLQEKEREKSFSKEKKKKEFKANQREGGHIKEDQDKLLENSINVHTVDMYQGDENDFVIVSLVRSNEERNIGFLSEMNRRCVAQSRARCGVYFIGNSNMFINNITWQYLIHKLKTEGRLGDSIGLVCERHPEDSFLVKDSDSLTLTSFCEKACGMEMKCGKHTCSQRCQPPHDHSLCKRSVVFNHSMCGHEDIKICMEEERHKECTVEVNFEFQDCSHTGTKKCNESISSFKCKQRVAAELKCGHRKLKKCHEHVDKVKCEEKCTQKMDACSHLCNGNHKCFEHGFQTSCKSCIKIQEAELVIQKEKERKTREENEKEIELQIKKMKEEAQKEKQVEYVDLLPKDETHAEYLEVEDLVKKYVQPGYNWYPTIKEIKKVANKKLRIKFLECSTKLFDPEPRVTCKFFDTNGIDVDEITKNGFKPTKTGIYFTTVLSETEQECTKDVNILILCEVSLGKSYEIRQKIDKKIDVDKSKLKRLERDSLFVPRGKDAVGVLYDEFVVFNPDQVFPKYIIHYTKQQFSVNKVSLDLQFSPTFVDGKKTMQPKRQVGVNNPLEAHFAFVESRFLRMLNRTGKDGKYEITHIDIYMNPKLESKFNAKVVEFKRKYPGLPESEPIYGFHGTKSSQIVDNIMNNNFIPSTQGKFGAGVYFSEQPSYTFWYGGQNHLIMARILPGMIKECQNGWSSGGCTLDYDSHGGFKQPDGTFNEIVIFNTDQILPSYVIYFKNCP